LNLKGGKVTLDGGTGSIGKSNDYLTIDAGSQARHKLNANASGGIFLTEFTNDLYIERIDAGQGNVGLHLVSGTLIDANNNQIVDERSREELLAGVWADLQLTESTGANAKITETYETYAISKQNEYDVYWQWRNEQPSSGTVDVDLIDTGDNTVAVKSPHSFSIHDPVVLMGKLLPPELEAGETYFIRSIDSATEFTLASVAGGSAIEFTGDSIDLSQQQAGAVTIESVPEYSVNQSVTLTEHERGYYTEYYTGEGTALGLTGDALTDYVANAIQTLENSRTTQYHTLHDRFAAYDRGDYSAGDLTTYFVDDFEYALTETESDSLRANIKIWTEEELMSTFSAGILAEVTDTQTTIEEFNIHGGDVTVSADAGGVGSYTESVIIDVSTTPIVLSDDDRVALSAADRSDILYTSGVKVSSHLTFAANSALGDTIKRTDGGNWITDGYVAGLHLRVESSSSNSTGDSEFWEIASVSPTTLRLVQRDRLIKEAGRYATVTQIAMNPREPGISLSTIEVGQRDDIDLTAEGVLEISATTQVFIGSEQNFQIRSVDTTGDVTVKSGGSIMNAASASERTIRAGSLLLEASDGSISNVDNPIRLDLTTGSSFTARAKDDIYVTEEAGNLPVDTIYSSEGGVQLVTLSGSILDNLNNGLTNIKVATNVTLNATGGGIAASNNFLDIDQGVSGVLNASATGDIYLWEVLGEMRADLISSSAGDVSLKSNLSIVDANAGEPDVVGNSITLNALGSGIGAPGNELDINSSHAEPGRLTSSSLLGDTYVNETSGDLYVNTVSTGESATAFISALSGRLLSDLIDPADKNVLSGRVYFFAAQDIGTASTPITTRISNVEGKSTAGSTYLVNTGHLEVGGVVAGSASGFVSGGSANIVAHSPITISEDFITADDLKVWATEDDGQDDNITLAEDVSITSTAGAIQFEAGDDIWFKIGSSVQAYKSIEILGDYQEEDTEGTTITIDAALQAPLIHISGGEQVDEIRLTSHASITGVAVIEGRGASDTISSAAENQFLNPVLMFGDAVAIVYDRDRRELTSLTSDAPAIATANQLQNTGGMAVMIGGTSTDTISGSEFEDWAIGDEALITFQADPVALNILSEVRSLEGNDGAADVIDVGGGDNFVMGGSGSDRITAADGVNTIIGDEGVFKIDSDADFLLAESLYPEIGSA
ncbi:MAG: hypothetical protein L7W43_11405, partial [Rubripirellula sp.]|nr:hypothetical protein [Rubripirellula sp.]